MPGHRFVILPATELVLRQYAGPLWRGIPLAEVGEAERPHPQLPPPWVLAYADWREQFSRDFDRRMEALGKRLPDKKIIRYGISAMVLLLAVAGLLAALAVGLVLSPLLGLGWVGARLAGGPAGGLRYGHTLEFLLTGKVRDLKHYDSHTNYPEENVPAAIAEARQYGYRVVVYALPGTTPFEAQVAQILVAEGQIDAFWAEALPLQRADFAARCGVNVPNSIVVVPDEATAQAWQQRGFSRESGAGRCTIWQPDAQAADASVKASNEAYWRRQSLKSQLHNPFPDVLHVATTSGLPDDVVLYLEPANTPPAVRAFFRQHERQIRAALAAENKHLMRWPDTDSTAADAEPDAALLGWLQYAHPALREVPAPQVAAVVRGLTQAISAAQFAEAVIGALDLPTLGGALWLRALADFGYTPSVRAHRFVPPPDVAGVGLNWWLAHRLKQCLPQIGRHPLADARFSLGHPPAEEMAAADWHFPDEGQRLPPELIGQIAALKAAAPAGALFELLLHVADQLAETHPAVKQTLLPLLRPSTAAAAALGAPAAPALSPLVIDAHYRLWLPAFGNLEIKLTPLPKTLLLFFLRQSPAGLMLHSLTDYQSALLALYQQLQPDVDITTARARIADLVDVRGNSINEKCSRIKEAFVREMTDEVARHYYITGDRGSPKGIQLPRALVRWAG